VISKNQAQIWAVGCFTLENATNMEDAKESARLRQSQIFATSHLTPKKRENAPLQKSGAAKLLEKKQKMFDLQEALEEEKLRFAEKVHFIHPYSMRG